MLISVTDANLKTVANGGGVGKSDGTDIVFTKLDHEIESYNASTGQFIGWVRIPALSPTADTVIYAYYGNASASNQQNATGVWDSNYVGVFHLPNGTTLNANDSSVNAVSLTNSGAAATSGIIDGAGSFNSDLSLGITTGTSMNVNGNITMEAWYKRCIGIQG